VLRYTPASVFVAVFTGVTGAGAFMLLFVSSVNNNKKRTCFFCLRKVNFCFCFSSGLDSAGERVECDCDGQNYIFFFGCFARISHVSSRLVDALSQRNSSFLHFCSSSHAALARRGPLGPAHRLKAKNKTLRKKIDS
jgi:hypothetical protein